MFVLKKVQYKNMNCILTCSILVTMLTLALIKLKHHPDLEEQQLHRSSRMDTHSGSDSEQLAQRLTSLESALERLWCKTQNVLSSGGFCITADNLVVGGNDFFDMALCHQLELLAGNSSIGDLGAGLGWYGMCLMRKTATPFQVTQDQKSTYMNNFRKIMGNLSQTPRQVFSWHGFDAAGNIESLSGGFIKQRDLSQEGLSLGRRWDWVMSIEVGEHISPQGEQFFLDNIVRHACKGVVLSWAVEGQGGHHHVNNHNNDYIKKQMADRGISNDKPAEDNIRALVTLGWLKNTVMVFRAKQPKTDCLLS